MAIVQISKIQQRSGNLVDLPQLDEAELGWASDAKRLFIGKTVPNENIEVLTSYSNISFSQITGAVGNLNITAVTAEDGQVLTYDGTDWVNRGATSGGLIDLGDASNVKLGGGAIGYVLETDGVGNLTWTPKTAVVSYISNVTQANPGVVTTINDNYFSNGSLITITDVVGMTQLNGNSYYAKILTSNTFSLYSDSALTTTVDTTGYTAYSSNGRVISAITGSGSGAAGGSNTTIQFNNSGSLGGSASLTWNSSTSLLTVTGNANVGNLISSGIATATRLVSNIATGTAPLIVTSTTPVANLSVATAGTVLTNAQPNITSVGTLSSLVVSGNANVGNLNGGNLVTANFLSGDGYLISNLSAIINGNSNVSVSGNSNVTMYVAGNTTARFTATSTGIVANGTMTVSGNANVGNLDGGNLVTANYFAGNGSYLTNIGTVTSIGITNGGGLSVSGSPVTTSGSITVGLASTAVTAGTYALSKITVDAQGRITSASSEPGGLRNFIINGGMIVAQRPTATMSATPGIGSVDRMMVAALAGTSVSGTVTQGTDSTFKSGKCLLLSGVTWTNGSLQISQRIESKISQPLNGNTITISCKINHDYGVSRDFRFSVYKADAVDNFTSITLISVVSPDTTVPSGTYTTVSGSITLGATDASNGIVVYLTDTASNNVVSKTVKFGDFQLELGSVATPVENRPYGLELSLCQRYYTTSYYLGTTPGTASGVGARYISRAAIGGYTDGFCILFPQTMRATPSTITIYSPQTGTSGYIYDQSTSVDVAVSGINYSGTDSCVISYYVTSTGTPYIFHFVANAEL